MNTLTNTIIAALAAMFTIFVIGNDNKVDVAGTKPTFILCDYFTETNVSTAIYGKHAMFERLNSSQIEEYKLNNIKTCNTFWQAFEEIMFDDEEDEWEEEMRDEEEDEELDEELDEEQDEELDEEEELDEKEELDEEEEDLDEEEELDEDEEEELDEEEEEDLDEDKNE